MFRTHFSIIPLAMLALGFCAGTAHAVNSLTLTTTVVSALKCDTTTGVSGSVTVKVVAAGATIGSPVIVSLPSLPAGIVAGVPVGSLTLTSATAFTTYTFSPALGCAGTTVANLTPLLQFQSKVGAAAAGNDVTQSLALAVTAGATSPLSVSPSSLTLSCTRAADGSFTGGAGTVTVTSSATGGTPVTYDTVPSWLTITPPGSNLAGTTAITFGALAACSGAVGSSKTATLHFLNLPAPITVYKPLTVTVQVVGPNQLNLSGGVTSGSPIAIVYTKNISTPVTGSVTVKTAALSTANLFFGLDTTTLPSWLTVNLTSAQTAGQGGVILTFTVTKVADSLTPGIYSAAIHLKVAGYADAIVYFSLTVKSAATTLSVAEGIVRNLSWSVGQPLPTATITALSSGSPIAYTITTSNGTAFPSVSQLSGLAYGFGTAIPVNFDPLAFAGAQPGSILTGTITLNWTGTAIPVVFNISINSPSSSAFLTGISPSNLPSAPSGQSFTVILYGSGFVSSTDVTQKTFAGVVSAGLLKPDANIAVSVVNASTIVLTITVPAATPADLLLPFAVSNIVNIGVCNPNGASCSTATGTWPLTIGAGPIIQSNGVTSASTFLPVAAGAGTVAPYDLLTIFGSNFCTSNGTGCASGQVLYPTLDSTLIYGTNLSPDNQRNLSVQFYPTGTTTGGWAAPLLFATNNQINLVVPGGLVTTAPTQYDIVVKFGTLSSAVYTVTSISSDPGVFVIDGVSQGAVILPNGAINGTGVNAAKMRLLTDSDTIAIYMTGLGVPLSVTANTASGGSAAFTDCISTAAYKTSGGLTTIDGAVIQSSVITPGRLVPCFDPATFTATVGGVAATVKYAGWAPDAIAGLYQVNLLLPAKIVSLTDIAGAAVTTFSVPVQVPVVVTLANATHSQSKVGIFVQPAQTLKALAPQAAYPFTVSSLSAAAGTPVALDTVTATGGTTPNYTVTAASGTDALGHTAVVGDFAVDLTSGVATINYPFAAGTFTVTITSTETGTPALPLETITLTITVT